MSKKNVNHKKIDDRKNEFNQKLLDGDEKTIEKFISICTTLDNNTEVTFTSKMNLASARIEEIATEIFDLAFIKKLDCKIVPEGLLSLVLMSNHINCADEVGPIVDEENAIFSSCYVCELSDKSVIRILGLEDFSDVLDPEDLKDFLDDDELFYDEEDEGDDENEDLLWNDQEE